MAFLKKLSFGKDRNKAGKQGKFIVIDGIDGSGKTTQMELLGQELKASGFQTEIIHFPQHGSRSAAMVDDYLAGKFGQLNPQAASIFYAIDRFDARPVIQSWLSEGKIVLCDRYVTANAGHQGGKIRDEVERLKFFKWLDNLEFVIFGIPKPDLNVILNMPAEKAVLLLKKRKAASDHEDNIHEKDLDHLKASEESYKQLARLFPNTKMVDCMEGGGLLSAQQIHNKVWELVRRIVLKNITSQH